MIVTTTLLAMVMYFVWGFIFIIPLAFLLFFGALDCAFWACTTISKFETNLSYVREIPTRGMVSMDSRRGNDLFHGLLALGNVQEKEL